MTRTISILLGVLAVACHSHDHKEGGHDHDDGDEHGHAHGGGDLPAEAVTLWTDKSELFVEYDPLVVGQESQFLAHVTILPSFKPATAGTATVTVTMTGGTAVVAAVNAPARPGIFIPKLTPTTAGDCTIVIRVESAALTDSYPVGKCKVYTNADAARANAKQEDSAPGRIPFLKEQQWPIDFGTAEVTSRTLHPGVATNAEIKAVPSRHVRITAATTGRIGLATPAPIVGMQVKARQLLAHIQPIVSASQNLGALRAEVQATQAELTAAKHRLDRLKGLLASDAVAKRRVDDALAAWQVAEARAGAARTRLGAYHASASGNASRARGAFRAQSPIAGTLVESHVTAGETVQAGAQLFTIIDLDRVWVEGRVYESQLAQVENSTRAWFTVEGRQDVFEIDGTRGSLITLGHVVDPRTRTVPVVFEVANPGRSLRIGQSATLTIGAGAAVDVLAIPVSALIQEGSQQVAYVQVEGEAFERRVVRTGVRSRGYVEVRAGIKAGEHVVVTGAYDVKLAASAGGGSAHGHAH